MVAATDPLQISVLSAPLGAIDRRLLSQAWYSALGYASAPLEKEVRAKASHTAPERRVNAPRSHGRRERHRGRVQPSAGRARQAAARAGCARPSQAPEFSEASDRTKSSAKRPARTSAKHFRATLNVEDNRGRVHVFLQSRGGAVRLIAVCKPEVRERVARALDEARRALLLRGVVLDARTQEGAPCT